MNKGEVDCFKLKDNVLVFAGVWSSLAMLIVVGCVYSFSLMLGPVGEPIGGIISLIVFFSIFLRYLKREGVI